MKTIYTESPYAQKMLDLAYDILNSVQGGKSYGEPEVALEQDKRGNVTINIILIASGGGAHNGPQVIVKDRD